MKKWLKRIFKNKVVRWLGVTLGPVLATVIVGLVTPLGQWIVQWATWGTINVTARTVQDEKRFREKGLLVEAKNVNTPTERRLGLNKPTRLEPGQYQLRLVYYKGEIRQLFSDSLCSLTIDSVPTNQVTIAARHRKDVEVSVSEDGFLSLSVSGIYNKDSLRIRVLTNDSRLLFDVPHFLGPATDAWQVYCPNNPKWNFDLRRQFSVHPKA